MSSEGPDVDVELAVVPRRAASSSSDDQSPSQSLTCSNLIKTPSLHENLENNDDATLSSLTRPIHHTLTISNAAPVPYKNGREQKREEKKKRKKKRKTVMMAQSRPRLLNNVLFSVGFLDLASASDFAANVWNKYPVPAYAKAFMVIGGLFALTMCIFAIKDFRLSYPNYVLLRSERQLLKSQRSRVLSMSIHDDGRLTARDLDSCLEVNFRELGNEVARLGMDAVMGFGVFLVGVGTLMALAGEDRRIFHASNLLSGYIGNAPIAFYGLMNSVWSIYIWTKTYQHSRAGRKCLKGRKVGQLLERRTRLLRLYSALYGVSGFFTGVSSLISSTMWFGYVISFPWVIAAIFCNYLLRKRIAYDRPTIRDMQRMDPPFMKDAIIEELEILCHWKSLLRSDQSDGKLSTLVLPPANLAASLHFLLKYDLFDDFCERLALKDHDLLRELYGVGDEGSDTPLQEITAQYTIDSHFLASVNEKYHPRLHELAVEVVDQFGLTKLKQRKRFLVEALGCFLYSEEETVELELEMEERERDSGKMT